MIFIQSIWMQWNLEVSNFWSKNKLDMALCFHSSVVSKVMYFINNRERETIDYFIDSNVNNYNHSMNACLNDYTKIMIQN